MQRHTKPIEDVLSENLTRLREKKRMSQESMAKYIGLSAHGYREIEEGRYVPTLKVLIKIAKTLNCTLHDLLPVNDIS